MEKSIINILSIDNLINSINSLYYQPINDNIKINIIIDFFNVNKKIFESFKEYNNNDRKKNISDILFNRFHQEEIIDDAINIYSFLNNKNKNNKYNYNDYVKIIKLLLEYYIKHKDINKLTNKIKLLDNDFNYTISNINNLIPITFQNYKCEKKIFNYIPSDNLLNKNLKMQEYSLKDTKKLDENLILYSYLCYFKTAINCLRHNIIFKFTNPFFTESLKESGGETS